MYLIYKYRQFRITAKLHISLRLTRWSARARPVPTRVAKGAPTKNIGVIVNTAQARQLHRRCYSHGLFSYNFETARETSSCAAFKSKWFMCKPCEREKPRSLSAPGLERRCYSHGLFSHNFETARELNFRPPLKFKRKKTPEPFSSGVSHEVL